MLYQLKLFFLRFLKVDIIKPFGYKIAKLLRLKTGDDIRVELIKKYASEKTFVDIGCMWRVNGRFAFLAEEFHARRVVAVDLEKTEEFLAEFKKRNSKIEFIQGDINLKSTIDKIGVCDVIFCSGVLYHVPNPISFLKQLKLICRETLILVTMVIPEAIGVANTAVFYPFLNEKQKKYWDLGVQQNFINQPCNVNNEYVNWFWGLSPSCVKSMLQYVGFNVEQCILRPFQSFFICRVG